MIQQVAFPAFSEYTIYTTEEGGNVPMITAKTPAAELILKACGGMSRSRVRTRLAMSSATWSRRVKDPATFTLRELKRLAELTSMSDDELLKLVKSIK